MKANFVDGVVESCRMASNRSAVDRMLEELGHCMRRLLGPSSNSRSFDPLEYVRRFLNTIVEKVTYSLVSMSSSKHTCNSSHHRAS